MTELPAFVDWFIFPFEGEFRVRDRVPANPAEHVRSGDPGGPPCNECASPDEDYLWVDDRWRVRPAEPKAIPLVFLETREHVDFEDMGPQLAAELGPLLIRIHQGIYAGGGIGRVHHSKWGDGSSHWHLWFFGRPVGDLQLAGFAMSMWAQVLPPMPTGEWDMRMSALAAHLATEGGTALR